jgi:tRNA(fMet)-specific endonuclease VapC
LIHLDTSFLVDLLRERSRGLDGPATRLLDRFAGEELGVSVFVACELLAGAELSANPAGERARVQSLLAALHTEFPDERFAAAYGRLFVWLSRSGGRIGSMDLLIATAAVVAAAPLVTRNSRHFGRVPELETVAY